jgi:hypothetical protein
MAGTRLNQLADHGLGLTRGGGQRLVCLGERQAAPQLRQEISERGALRRG